MTDKTKEFDTPLARTDAGYWGSDLIAETLRGLGYKHVALNPGSSFRGLHDSLVNHLGNCDPQMVLCLHEEHAVSIAHGWAKVTGEPMAVILHANVGLMHASMAIYNAWCDRVPMAIFGATGPVAADKRRPWIDWIHTSRDQAAIVRDFVKWDDQPASLEASLTSMVRADRITRTVPHGPTYVCFDVSVQEDRAPEGVTVPNPASFAIPAAPEPSAAQIEALAGRLARSKSPVFLVGRVSRSVEDWAVRVALSEHLNACVITDIKTGASFPTDHPLHIGPPSFFLADSTAKAVAAADLIVALDWVDPAGALKQAGAKGDVVNVSLDHLLASGWAFDHMEPPAASLHIAAEPDAVLRALAAKLGVTPTEAHAPNITPQQALAPAEGAMTMDRFAQAIEAGFSGEPVTFVRLPLGWNGGARAFRHPLDYLGYDGGAGIGSGPGMLVGAALALKGGDRIPVGVLGDGDTMMGVSALWSAARYDIPMIAVVCNNRSYFNDEVHQEKVARIRARPVENKHIGQAIREPEIDFTALARAQGLAAIGPVETPAELVAALQDAVGLFRQEKPVLIEARVDPEYSEAMSKGMTETGG